MHPAVIGWFRARRHGECGASAGCGPHGGFGHHDRGHDEHEAGPPGFGGPFGGGPFGVRRPLRFLAHKLDLDDKQVGELSRILSDLKTERAQAAVDERRALTAFADLVAASAFEPSAAEKVSQERTASTARVNEAVAKALGRIHALLRPEQREQLAYLVRTGVLSL